MFIILNMILTQILEIEQMIMSTDLINLRYLLDPRAINILIRKIHSLQTVDFWLKVFGDIQIAILILHISRFLKSLEELIPVVFLHS